MKISNSKYSFILNLFIILIACTIIFRKPCTNLIITFAVYCLFYSKKLSFTKTSIQLSTIIALPLLTEIFFFWNNDSYLLGFKSLEKYISLLLFPVIIVSNYKWIDFYKIIRYYAIITTFIVFLFYIFYINFDDKYIKLYSVREDYFWTIGYSFANYVGMHGPALNMHLAFVTVINFYFIFYNFKNTLFQKILSFLHFCISFYLMVFVNSKLAFAIALFGIVLVFAIEIRKLFSPRKVMILFATIAALLTTITFLYMQKNPYMIIKYQEKTFAYFDKIGKLDEVKNPEATVYHSLATRVSIWKSTVELSSENLLFGLGASDAKPELVKYFKKTNQIFLAKFEFPVHNQFLDSLLKFGILGLISTFLYIFNIARLGYKTKNTLIIFFFVLFFTSNLTDDFLIRFDGIVFSGFWVSFFSAFYLQKTYLHESAVII